ncbi:hypothetical protein [Alcaligenes aquatilis]|uniref:hypothetical protein n=1 Tax=Alcaligenes aquatilis TaxID=323284 RepID=UPI0036140B06
MVVNEASVSSPPRKTGVATSKTIKTQLLKPAIAGFFVSDLLKLLAALLIYLISGANIRSTIFNNPPADVAHPAYVGVFVRLNSTHKHGCGSARYLCRLQSVKARFTEKKGEA